jgi:hypothetical protein
MQPPFPQEVIVSERRFKYEEAVKAAPLNYDAWFDYVKLEEGAGDVERTRAVFERAIANVPPAPEKRYWQRYIYLWVRYALYEELEAGACLGVLVAWFRFLCVSLPAVFFFLVCVCVCLGCVCVCVCARVQRWRLGGAHLYSVEGFTGEL